MAELVALSAASPVVKTVVEKLATGLWRELGLARSVYTDLGKLKRMLSTIQDVLDDAERKSITSNPLQGWLRKLRDAALDAEDVVDECEAEALRRRMERVHDRMTGKVRDFFSSNNPIAFRYKIAGKIREIRERFDEITKENRDFNLMGKSDSDRPVDRETFSSVIESEIYGRDDDKKEVIEFLVDKDNDKNISILPIVGLGGVGKTTLARLVYNDKSIEERFELRMWVCVGESFDAKVIFRAMIEQVAKEQSSFSTLETMSSFLEEKLRAKRFLLVLDDLWDKDVSKWDEIKRLLVRGELGSKIIITTRSEIVASITGTISPHKLQGLRDDDCWALFKQKAFGLSRQENPELVEIGREIIKKCGGLPLAAKALGSLMCTKREKTQWLAIKNNEIWKLSEDKIGTLPENKIEILPILKLSYDHLPPHLKRCFTYCSVFPKDYEFHIKTLIQLWMAEGLIGSSDTSQNVEDIGKQCFDSLLWRSFFQDVRMDVYNNIDRCKMHDLVHDLACSLTKGESLVMEMGSENIPHECRYLSVVLDDVASITSIHEAKKLRSLILLGDSEVGIDEIFFNITKKCTQIRALGLSWSGIEKLSDRMSRLKQLRFLDLSHTEITTLPTSITRLYNLQTLNLRRCSQLRELPEDISNLSNLKHMDISECDELSCMPRYLGRLSNLEILGMFIVGRENGRTIAELQHLNSIRGELEIKNLHDVKDANEAMQANLGAKSRLNYLKLQWNENLDEAQEPSSTEVEVAAGVLERLQPHHNLKRLGIIYYMGIRLPNWMASTELASSSFPNLLHLKLWNLERCEHVPSLGRLPLLQQLIMVGMHAVERIGDEFYGGGGGSAFPSLQVLYLSDMPNLEEWHTKPTTTGRQIASFPHLSNLWIKSCPKLMVHPCIPCSVENLEISRNNGMLLSAGSLAGLSKLKKLEILGCGVSSSSSFGCWDGLQYLTALEKLQIWGCDELTCLPEGIMYLPSLYRLTLRENRNLRSLEGGGRKQQQQPTPFFPALQDLTIIGTDTLTTLSEWVGGLTALQDLYIGNCPQLAMLPDGLRHLTALQKLQINDFSHLAMLPDGLGHLTALQHLKIRCCPQLAMLPDGLGHLTALQHLKIRCCPQLAMLPDGLRHLTALQHLEINNCPQLARRCKQEIGEDWHKIAHIPDFDMRPKEDGEESSKPSSTFATKFLGQFGCARFTGRS